LLEGTAHSIVSVNRVAELLGETYAALFSSRGPLRHLSPDLSPWELRPTLVEIVKTPDLAAAVRRAKRHGYRVADVAAHLGISEVTLWRRVKETGSVP
jgi:transcriptional regulator of acetoin/glycerol metabolism